MSRQLSRWSVIGACAFLWSCGPGERGAERSAATPGAPAAAPTAASFNRDTLARCAGYGPAQASEILGVPASAVIDKSEDISPNTRGCGFAQRDDSSKTLLFSLNFEESVDDANTTFAQMRDTLSLGSRVQESATGTKSAEGAYSDILGLGEEAVWSTVNGSLAVRQKNITILVMAPSDKNTQVKVAQQVLQGMR